MMEIAIGRDAIIMKASAALVDCGALVSVPLYVT